MAAQKLDLTLYDNDTLTLRLSLRTGTARSPAETALLPPLVLTGWGAILQIRKPLPPNDLIAELSTPGLAGHTGVGIDISTRTDGDMTLTFDAAIVTPAFVAMKQAEYDLVLVHPSGKPYRVMTGAITARRGITRP